ncbi:MAG: hypothetical protein ABIV94_11530 [Acidimicrobiales bacterium]
MNADDELERSRADFAARVDRRYDARTTTPSLGKGSPIALLTTGVIGTLLLGLTAVALGGGLLFVPALIPLVTVVGVLVARRLTT